MYKIRRPDLCYNTKNADGYAVSRYRVDLFFECPLCFWLREKKGVDRPFGPPFTLNKAVDTLLRREFDQYRESGAWHPVLKQAGLRLKPWQDKRLAEWSKQEYGKGGIRYIDPETKLDLFGELDDVWVNAEGEVHVVDYKATAKDEEVSLDADWQISYKRQAEFYQWLLRKNGLKVSNTAYFYYVNGKTDAGGFKGVLEFDVKIIPYEGSDTWIPKTLSEIKACLESNEAPAPGEGCEFCAYRNAASETGVSAKAKEDELPMIEYPADE